MEKSQPITKEYFEITLDKRFDLFEKKIDKKFDDLALIIARGFHEVDLRFIEQEKNLKEYMHENFASKLDLYETENRLSSRIDRVGESVEKIEGHIGRMDIRSSNLEEIVLKDHSSRLKTLELASAS